MFGFHFIKVPPTTYLIRYAGGRIVKQGAGISFWYFAPSTTLLAIPVGANEQPFIFEELSTDYQSLTVQGQINYSITDPEKISKILDFSIYPRSMRYASEDPEKLSERIINIVKVLVRKELEKLKLASAITAAESITGAVFEQVKSNPELASLGVSILGVSILAIRPNPETARALEAETKEALLKQADEAIYARRNSAVELERSIRENELNTEIAVELKKRQIREAQLEGERIFLEKQYELQKTEMSAKITLEEQNKELVALAAENSRCEAEAGAYGVEAMVKAVSGVDPTVLQVLASGGMSPQQLISRAFQSLAENAEKIGELNISPDLLNSLLTDKQGASQCRETSKGK